MHAPGLVLACSLLVGGLVALSSLGGGMLYPAVRERIERLAPEDRALLLKLMAALPWLLAVGALLLALLPSFVTVPGWIEDHCLPHEHHPHLCLVHGIWAPSGLAWVIAGALALAGGTFWARLIYRLYHGHRQVRMLLRLARQSGSYHVLPSGRFLAFSAGLWRPRTLLTTKVLDHLEEGDLAVVLAHESAHAQRRDALQQVLIEALLVAVPRQARSILLGDFSLACEEACDRLAAADIGSPQRVAEVLLKVQRLGVTAPAGVPGATGSQLLHRVQALLNEPYPPHPSWVRGLWLSPLLLLLADPVHHFAETLLGLLVR